MNLVEQNLTGICRTNTCWRQKSLLAPARSITVIGGSGNYLFFKAARRASISAEEPDFSSSAN